VRSVVCFRVDHSMHDEAYDDATQKGMTNEYSADGMCLIAHRDSTRSVTILSGIELYAQVKDNNMGRRKQRIPEVVRRRRFAKSPRD
jgi:hypothetical protein